MEETVSTLFLEITPEVESYIHHTSSANSKPAENVLYNTSLRSSPVVIQRLCDGPEVVVPLHCHDFLEVLYCRQASNVEYLIQTNRYRLQPGDIVLLPPNTPHRAILSKGTTSLFVRDILWFRKDIFQSLNMETPEYFQRNQASSYLIRTSSSKFSYIGNYFQSALDESLTRAFRWNSSVLAYGVLALVDIGRALMDKSSPPVATEPPQLFDRLLRYIEDNLSNKITLEEAAQFFYVSKSTVTRVFQKHTGTSFYRYVTQRRLVAATPLILSGIPLESVGESVGFSDYPTFYRAFKQEYGISPSQFRKEQAQKY